MLKSRTIVAVAIASALLLPVGAATWFSRGTYEPDTNCDTAAGCKAGDTQIMGGYMYQEADTSPTGLQVYFNGYIDYGPTSLNPNSEVTGSRLNSQEWSRMALLGIWKDCNKDGYIGAASSALHVYRADVGDADASICPPGEMFQTEGGWVYEFIWIGNGNHRAGDDPWDFEGKWINDTESLVWSDDARPGAAPTGTCPLTSFPQGTFASTGGIIRWVDCIAGRRIVMAANTVDGDGSLGLRFEGDPSQPQRSDSQLNQKTVNLFGDPYAGEDRNTYQTGLLEKDSQKDREPDYDPRTEYDPENTDKAFHVWDCSDPQANKVENPTGDDFVSVDDPSGGMLDATGATGEVGDEDDADGKLSAKLSRDGVITSVPNPAPGVDNAQGSYYDGVNHTERGGANVWFGGNIGGNGAENCNPDNSTVSQRYSGVETRAVAPAAALKVSTEWYTFNLGGGPPRGRSNASAFVRDVTGSDLDRAASSISFEDELVNRTGDDSGGHANNTLGSGYQYGLNFRSGSPGGIVLRPGWNGFHITTNIQNTVRGDGTPAPGMYFTFYAKIGAATTITGAKTAKDNIASLYLNEYCNGSLSGASTAIPGVDCDASHWWNPNFGAPAMPQANGHDIGAKVHMPFHLRDVDCVDGTLVRGVQVYASLAGLSQGGPCADAS